LTAAKVGSTSILTLTEEETTLHVDLHVLSGRQVLVLLDGQLAISEALTPARRPTSTGRFKGGTTPVNGGGRGVGPTAGLSGLGRGRSTVFIAIVGWGLLSALLCWGGCHLALSHHLAEGHLHIVSGRLDTIVPQPGEEEVGVLRGGRELWVVGQEVGGVNTVTDLKGGVVGGIEGTRWVVEAQVFLHDHMQSRPWVLGEGLVVGLVVPA